MLSELDVVPIDEGTLGEQIIRVCCLFNLFYKQVIQHGVCLGGKNAPKLPQLNKSDN